MVGKEIGSEQDDDPNRHPFCQTTASRNPFATRGLLEMESDQSQACQHRLCDAFSEPEPEAVQKSMIGGIRTRYVQSKSSKFPKLFTG